MQMSRLMTSYNHSNFISSIQIELKNLNISGTKNETFEYSKHHSSSHTGGFFMF